MKKYLSPLRNINGFGIREASRSCYESSASTVPGCEGLLKLQF